jgi:diketogulonate reductase-like aldo/keto reductase
LVPRRFYRMIGERVSAIGLGTWAIRDYERAFDVFVKAIIEYGVNSLDTAEIYGSGEAERFLSKVIDHVGREEVFITTKLPPERFSTRDRAIKAAKASLSRLGVREVDLLLVHWPDPLLSVETIIRNLEAVAEAGLTRFIGVSNFDLYLLREAMEAVRSHEIVADQIHYSILYKDTEREGLVDFAVERGLMVQAYRAIERGAVAREERLIETASLLGITPIQLAVAYVLNRCKSCMVLVKTENEEHLREVVEAAGIKLSGNLVEKLSAL